MATSLCVAIVLSYAHDDPLTQPITYDQPAQTVKQLLKGLSRQTGVKLFAPSPIDAEIVLVMVRDMPLKELMAHLATVTDGEWFKQPDGSYHLVRTPKIIKERRQQDDEQILQGLRRTLNRKENQRLISTLSEQEVRQIRDKIKELMREVQTQDIRPAWDSPSAQTLWETHQLLVVGGRLIARLLQQIDLRRLLEIPVGERRVFSNVRGRFLQPLGFSVQPLLQQYLQESQLVYQAWTHPTEGLDPESVNQFNHQYSYLLSSDYWLRQKPLTNLPTRVYLIVRRSMPDEFSCSVALATDDMRESQDDNSSHFYLGAQRDEEAEEDKEETKPAQPQKPAEPSVKVEWSERSRQFIEAYRAMAQTADAVPWPAILDPSQTEPLSLIPSDVLRTYARQQGKAIVALLSDDFAEWMDEALSGTSDLKIYLERLKWRTERQETEKLILLKPRLFSYGWGQRTDRAALMRWIERVRQRGYLQLEDHIALSQFAPSNYHSGLFSEFYLQLLVEDSFWWLYFEPIEMRFLASLSAAQLSQLRAGQPLSFASLTPAQREHLIRALYFGSAKLSITWIYDESGENDMPPYDMEYHHPIALIHAFYPDSLPADLTIQIENTPSGETEPVDTGVFTRRKAGVWSGFCDLSEVASDLHIVQNLKAQPLMDEYALSYHQTQVERYRSLPLMPARRRPFQLEVRLSKNHTVKLLGYWWGDEFGDYELLNDGKPATLDNLPQELKQKLQEELERWKRSPESEGL